MTLLASHHMASDSQLLGVSNGTVKFAAPKSSHKQLDANYRRDIDSPFANPKSKDQSFTIVA